MLPILMIENNLNYYSLPNWFVSILLTQLLNSFPAYRQSHNTCEFNITHKMVIHYDNLKFQFKMTAIKQNSNQSVVIK